MKNKIFTCKEIIKMHPVLGAFFMEEEITELDESRTFSSLKEFLDWIESNRFYRYDVYTSYLLYSPFLDNSFSDITKRYNEIVRPEPFINSQDCGVIFRGISEEKEPLILIFFEELYGRISERVLDTGEYRIAKNGTVYLSFLRQLELWYYKHLGKKMQKLFYKVYYNQAKEALYIHFRDNSYKDIKELVRKTGAFESLNYTHIKEFIIEHLGVDTAEATKTVLLLKSYGVNDLTGLYVGLEETKKWGILGIQILEKEEGDEIIGNKIYSALLKIYPNKLIQAMNENIENILSEFNYSANVLFEVFDFNKFQFKWKGDKVILDFGDYYEV